MNKALLSVFTLLMLVFPIFSISAFEGNSHLIQTNSINQFYGRLDVPSPLWLRGADQMQINSSKIGLGLDTDGELAQSFKPTKNTLTAVALFLYRAGAGKPNEQTIITIAIRDELDGPDLTNITIMAKDWTIKSRGTWVLFDFPDIQVFPEQTYYIHGNGSHGGYVWIYRYNNEYPRGDGWIFEYDYFYWGTLWEWYDYDPKLSDPDFCFITYYQEPKYKALSHLFYMFLEHHPHVFRIIRKLVDLENGVFFDLIT
jgi:hypothetical protein